MKVEIFLNNEWLDISNQIYNAIQFDYRIDEVFDTGSFTFESKTINYNIPPHTMTRIDGEYWLCSSTCNEIIPSNPKMYNHQVELLEVSFLMQTIIIGAKVLSNTPSFKSFNSKAAILTNLANIKNELLFGAANVNYFFEIEEVYKEIEREHTFGDGTSLFQALLELGKTINAIPYISHVANRGIENSGKWNLTISWFWLDSGIAYPLDKNKILKFEMMQDVENYTSVLESNVYGVVDRDSVVTINNLTVRSEEAIISSDNQVLLLPSKAEKIEKMDMWGLLIGNISISHLYPKSELANYASITWGSIKNLYPDESNWIIVKMANLGLYEFDDSLVFTILSKEDQLGLIYYEFYVNPSQSTQNIKQKFNITNRLLEKNQFDLLGIADKPKYLTYKSGSNKIENLYKKYKGDLWSNILKTSSGPFIKEFYEKISGTYTTTSFGYGGDLTLQLNFITGIEQYYNPIYYAFNVQYVPMVDTFVKSSNTKLPFNEEKIKATSRSFELGANQLDFNLIIPAINKQNDMLAMPEITIEYVGKEYPNIGAKIIIKGKGYYVSSVQTSIISGRYISYINLVSNYSKIAEVFGVASQYESTRNPLTGIIDRIVYLGERNISSATGLTVEYGYTKRYKRGPIISYNNESYLIVEAQDNYIFDTGMVENTNLTSGLFENKMYEYGRGNDTTQTYYFEVVQENETLTIGESRNLPVLGNYTTLDSFTLDLYKDPRERMIFVVKMVQ